MISLANLKNYLFDGAFHSSNLSIIHPSMYLSTDSFNKYLLSTHCVIDSWDTTMKQSAVVPSLMGLQLQEVFLLLTYYSSLWRVIPLQLWPNLLCIYVLSLQYNYTYSETRMMSDTILLPVTGKSSMLPFWMNVCRLKYSAQVGMERFVWWLYWAFEKLTHLLPGKSTLAGGWGVSHEMLCTTVGSKNKKYRVTIKLGKVKSKIWLWMSL